MHYKTAKKNLGIPTLKPEVGKDNLVYLYSLQYGIVLI